MVSRVADRRSQLVLGLDPDPAHLWPEALELTESSAPGPPADRAARAVAAHCALVLDAAAQQCVAVKLQVACFEQLGAPGWQALSETARHAREHGLLVIADAKRGDVDITASAYARAFLGETETPYGPVAGLDADALTVNPLLGEDSLRPLLATARERRRGLFVLVRTSNPGASELQELRLAQGGSLSTRLSALVAALGAEGVGSAGLSDVGAVVGATAPGRLEELRGLMPRTPFLLPGVGAQGGRVGDLAAAFSPGPAGGLIAVSRGIVEAQTQAGGPSAQTARDASVRLREEAWALATNVSGGGAIV